MKQCVERGDSAAQGRDADIELTYMVRESHPIPAEWLAEFEAAARRPLRERFKYAFIKTYKPVMDDATYRSWESTAEYRKWCEENLPAWLGYGQSI